MNWSSSSSVPLTQPRLMGRCAQASVYGDMRFSMDARLTATGIITEFTYGPVTIVPDIRVGFVAFMAGPVPITLSFYAALQAGPATQAHARASTYMRYALARWQ